MTIYSLDVLLFLFGTSLLFHVHFQLLLPDLHTGFSRGRSGGMVFPSHSEFSTVYCDPHKGFGLANKAEIDVFLELSWFFDDPVDVCNLISGSSAFSKTSLNSGISWFTYCWNLAWRILSIPLLACEMSAIVYFEHSLALPFFGIGMKTNLFQSCGHCWVFQIFWHTECSTFTASSFRNWNRSTGISSPPLGLFIVMLPKAHLTHIPWCLALGEWPHHHDYLGCEDLFCTVLLCILTTSS